MIHLAINNRCNDITNVEECHWDMGNCCGRIKLHDCMICKCHLPLSQALNGTTYQFSNINYYEQVTILDNAHYNYDRGGGLKVGNWI